VDFVIARCALGQDSVLVDVGCGTGISSRAFAERGVKVIGIEPNEEMRLRAEVEPMPLGGLRPVFRAGRAEATGLPDGCADAALAAQAFHWFDPEPTTMEFHRILKSLGWAVVMYNERDESDAFTAAYSAVVRAARDSAAIEASRIKAGEILLKSPLFQDAARVVFPNVQILDEGGLLGRAFSASYAPREPPQAAGYTADVRRVFGEHQHEGRVTLRYHTSVYLARRRMVSQTQSHQGVPGGAPDHLMMP
jgi:SAM-dependent methyltransferase